MQAFINRLPDLLDGMFEHDAPMPQLFTCHCGEEGIFRCLECRKSPRFCASCIVEMHRRLPFHRVQRCNGERYVQTPLVDLGLVISLGHEDNDLCPHIPPQHPPQQFTVVHTNGHHRVTLQLCHCHGHPDPVRQLMRMGLFLTTVQDPQRISSAFTFASLTDFHIQSLTSKKSAYDYCEALCRHTDRAFSNTVTTKYQEFLRVVRMWHHLVALKHSGQVHGIDSVLSHRTPGTLAVRCPACPEDNFNMPDSWRNTHASRRYIHQRWLSIDGNFSAQKKKKQDDPDDVTLGEGHGYCAESSAYWTYLSEIGETPEVNAWNLQKSTCAHLKAVNMQNKAKFKNAEITSVVAVVCARHGIIQPGAIVDLQKGKRYANVDYALAQALRECTSLQDVGLTYDVACQYMVHLVTRFRQHFPTLVPVVFRMTALIPKMHLAGHKLDCGYRWSLKFTYGMGRTCGELIETVWSELNQANGSVKEMNHGHRHDTLDDLYSDWNWSKVQNMRDSLYHSLIDAQGMAKQAQIAFENIPVAPHVLVEWEAMSTEPYKEGEEWRSVYRPRFVKAPTQVAIFQELSLKGHAAERAGTAVVKNSYGHLLSSWTLKHRRHLKEQSRSTTGTDTTPQMEAEIARSRLKLRRDIEKWCKYQVEHCLALQALISDAPHEDPEEESLFLPSHFPTTSQRQKLGVYDLGLKEILLLVLPILARQRNNEITNLAFKKKEIRGQRDNTRAQSILKSSISERDKYVQKYRVAQAAMIRLGMAADNTTYLPLRDTDLWMKAIVEGHALGDGRREESWIWRTGFGTTPSDASRTEWEKDVDWVQWFRARAHRDRWREEVEILEEEFRRTYRSFTRMCEVWKVLAAGCDHSHAGVGRRAYAHEQADMYEGMAAECQQKYEKAKGVVHRSTRPS
ncbi:hypothetical protein JB92DRAFT_2786172 [Gautieria morchelliformis]|nr:hypothetical protein JB92DRAFT_2786172 [Gautieria morchelliformis]